MATGQLMLQSFYEERERQLRLHGAHHAAEVPPAAAAAGPPGSPTDHPLDDGLGPAHRAGVQPDLGPGEAEAGGGVDHLALDVSGPADGYVHAVVNGGGGGAKSGSLAIGSASASWASGSSGGLHPLAARAQAPAWPDGDSDRLPGGTSAAAAPASPASPLGAAPRMSWGSGELRQGLQRNSWADLEAGDPSEGPHEALRRPVRPAVQLWRAPGPARLPAAATAQAPRDPLRDPPASELAFVMRDPVPAGGLDAPSDWV